MGDKVTKRQPRKLVVLEEGTILGLALNQAAVREFPFLAGLGQQANKQQGCGSCGQAAQARALLYGDAKRRLASLDSDKKRRLKELLNAQKARVVYRGPGGRLVELTF